MYGNTGLKISALCFGCMRLPEVNGRVDRSLSTPLLHRAIELGINLFDTAIGYCNSDSQAALGEAMQGIDRSTIILSTKNPHHTVSADEWRRHLEESLKLLRTDYIDIYNHHGIGWNTFVKHLDPAKDGLTKALLRAKEEGLIRHAGFSFHDAPEALIKLADTGYYESVILQYNLLDQSNAQAMLHVQKKGLGIIVMGPVGGGRLGLESSTIASLTDGAAHSTVEAALRFVWGNPAVNVALSGMGTMAMLEENAALASNAAPFTDAQITTLNRLVEERRAKSGIYCSGCNYCTPVCPAHISIPQQIDLLNLDKIYGLHDHARRNYAGSRSQAATCIACGACLEKCPQKINIPARLHDIVNLLDTRAGTITVEPVVNSCAADGTFTMHLNVRSFTDREHDGTIELIGNKGTAFDTDRIEIKAIPAFGRTTKTISGRVAVPGNPIDYTLRLTYNNQQTDQNGCYHYLLLRKEPHDDSAAIWHTIVPTEKNFTIDHHTSILHRMRFKLSYDETGLNMTADVADDFLFPSNPAVDKGKLVDGLELFLDGRRLNRIGFPAYEDGVYQLGLYPGTPGIYDPFHAVFNSKKEMAIDLKALRTAEGYQLSARIPFAAFCTGSGVPQKIGFDIGVNTANATGERIGNYVWVGKGDNYCNAGNFCAVYLV